MGSVVMAKLRDPERYLGKRLPLFASKRPGLLNCAERLFSARRALVDPTDGRSRPLAAVRSARRSEQGARSPSRSTVASAADFGAIRIDPAPAPERVTERDLGLRRPESQRRMPLPGRASFSEPF